MLRTTAVIGRVLDYQHCVGGERSGTRRTTWDGGHLLPDQLFIRRGDKRTVRLPGANEHSNMHTPI